MHAQYVVRALRCPTLRPAERLVLADLANYANDHTRRAWPARALLCANTGLHHTTVQAALRRLIALGYITEVRRARPGLNREFRLHPEVWPTPPDPTPERTS